ncbi:hypothetical protein CXQ84_27655 [Burkholderia pseudomallei]|nr:hypothetical protein CXQ84_27655 [Burkholderia pseudomallei]
MTKMSPKRDGRPAMRAPRALEHRARRTAESEATERRGRTEGGECACGRGREREGRKAAASRRAPQKKAGQGELSGQSAIAPAGANAPRVLEGNQAPRSNLV